MKKVSFIIIFLAIAALLIAGCESKTQGTGYATYSGGAQPAPSGGGGCGRFSDMTNTPCTDSQPVEKASQPNEL